jgi:hypothetical protein
LSRRFVTATGRRCFQFPFHQASDADAGASRAISSRRGFIVL